MNGDFSEFHDELRAVARDVLTKTSPGPVDWQLLAASGWSGLEVPEDLGGAGATFAEVAVILHEMGRSAAASAYLGSVVLGVGALNLAAPGELRDGLLQRVATGAVRAAVALPTGDDGITAFRLDRSESGPVLTGSASFVPDADEAEVLLVLAPDPESGPVLVEVNPAAEGVAVSPQPLVDVTRRFAQVSLDGVSIDDTAVWRFAGDPDVAVATLLDRGALAVACDSLGLAEAMLEATVDYAKVRHQFGRPIGSFQAVKHGCANMLVQVEVCRALVSAAVQQLVDGDASIPVSMAKSYTGAAAVDVVGEAMQLHGGIGYTWESGVHAYLKRALLNRSLFGSPAAHRRRLARRYP
ncbi:MAG: acyl-CoA/acyl-ACP dehydrogenase [Acidimicrobiaceae bacterium]|nr:acyl-CoA/acyl-ACP dehydrogenase [Acidimicrobiaceae bacterium]